jgi:uncharacterized protein YdaU (DUF1376 family)
MKKPAAMPIFGDSYLADTTHLTTEEHGAYFLLLLAAWRQPDCALPLDERVLARIAGVSLRKWKSGLGETVLAFWTVDARAGRVFQRRQRREMEFVTGRRDAARAAAEERWSRENEDNPSQFGDTYLKNTARVVDGQPIENTQSEPCEGICDGNAPPPTHLHTSHMEEEEEGDGTGEKLNGNAGGGLFGDMPDAEPPDDPAQQFVEVWNGMARANGLRTIVKLTDQRRKRVLARLKDYGLPTITEAIAAVPSRPFLMGEGPRGWKADFDFITRPDSVAKIMEGKYGERERGKPSGWR